MSEETAELKETIEHLKKSVAALTCQNQMTRGMVEALLDEIRLLRRQVKFMDQSMDAMLKIQTSAGLKKSAAPTWRTATGVLAAGGAAVAKASRVQAETDRMKATEPKPPKPRPSRTKRRWAPFFTALLLVALIVVGSYLLGRMVFSYEVALWTAGFAGAFALNVSLVQLVPKRRRPGSPSTF